MSELLAFRKQCIVRMLCKVAMHISGRHVTVGVWGQILMYVFQLHVCLKMIIFF